MILQLSCLVELPEIGVSFLPGKTVVDSDDLFRTIIADTNNDELLLVRESVDNDLIMRIRRCCCCCCVSTRGNGNCC